jgi:hypothetical protein
MEHHEDPSQNNVHDRRPRLLTYRKEYCRFEPIAAAATTRPCTNNDSNGSNKEGMNHQVNPYRTMNRILEQCRAKCFASAVNFGLRKCVCRICTEAEWRHFQRCDWRENTSPLEVKKELEKIIVDTYVLLDGGAPKVIRIDRRPPRCRRLSLEQLLPISNCTVSMLLYCNRPFKMQPDTRYQWRVHV